MISLNSSLIASAIGCSQPERTDPVGADAHLHVADHLALGQREIGHDEHQRHHDGDDLDQRPDHQPGRAERLFEGVEHALDRRPFRRRHARQLHCAEHAAQSRPSGMSGRRCARSPPARAHPALRAAPPLRRPALRAPGRPRAARDAPSGSPAFQRRGRGVGRRLQRRRAAHQRVGEIDRHLRDALDRSAVRRDAGTRRQPGALERRAAISTPCSASARTSSALPSSNPGNPSRLPSTRRTFQAGRVSPSGLHHAHEALQTPFGADEGAGGLGERGDRQQHMRVVERAVLERRHARRRTRRFASLRAPGADWRSPARARR